MILRIIAAVLLAIVAYMLAHLVLNEFWSTIIGLLVALAVLFGDRLDP